MANSGQNQIEGAISECQTRTLYHHVQKLGNHSWQCLRVGWQYRIKNMAAIALQCKVDVKLIAAAFALYSM